MSLVARPFDMADVEGARCDAGAPGVAMPTLLLWCAFAMVGTAGAFLLLNPAAVVKALAAGAGAGVALALLLEPALGLPAVLFVVQSNLATVAEGHGVADIGKFLTLYIGGVLVLRAAVLRERRTIDPLTVMPAVLYMLAGAATLLYAAEPGATAKVLGERLKDFLLLVLLVVLLTDARQLRIAAWSWIAAGGLLGTLVTYQAVSGDHAHTFGGLANWTTQHIYGEINSPRLSGPFPDPNYFAQIMLLVVPVATERMLHERNPLARLAAAWVTLAGAFSVIASYSRGGQIGLLLFTALLAWRYRRSRVVWVAAVVAIAAGGFVIPFTEHGQRFQHMLEALGSSSAQGGQEPAVAGRVGEMKAALMMFLDHPLFGIGVGNYETRFQQYSLENGLMLRGADRPAHSLYLEVAAERGIVGLTFFAALLLSIAHNVLRTLIRLRRTGHGEESDQVAAFGCGFLLYMVAATFLHDAFDRYFWIYTGFALALPQILRDPRPAMPFVVPRNRRTEDA